MEDPEINEQEEENNEEIRNEQLNNEENQNIIKSEEKVQLDIEEIDKNDELAEEEIISRPMMTRRGRIVKMPARFLFLIILFVCLLQKLHTIYKNKF